MVALRWVRTVAPLLLLLLVSATAWSDDAWEKRLEASVAKFEETVKKVDGKTAANGPINARLAALDARVGEIETKAGRTKGAESVLTTGQKPTLLSSWTTVLSHLTTRLQDAQRTNKPPLPPAPAKEFTESSNLVGSGTGFFITPEGELVTCAHVVEAGKTYRVATETGQYPAFLVKVNKDSDLAILRVRGTFSPLPVSPGTDTRLGATVGTVGYPNPELQGRSPKATKGEISSLAGIKDDQRYFQVSLPIQPGNSGGALFDVRGNVVGVVAATLNQDAARSTSGVTAQNVNYAVKSAHLIALATSVPDLRVRMPKVCLEDQKFEDVVTSAQKATVMVLVYDGTGVADTGGAGVASRPGGRPTPTTLEEVDLFPERFVGSPYLVDQVWLDGDLDRWGDYVLVRLTNLRGKSTVNVPRRNGIVFALSTRMADKVLALGLSANSKYMGKVTFDVSLLKKDWIANVREISIYSKAGTILHTLTE